MPAANVAVVTRKKLRWSVRRHRWAAVVAVLVGVLTAAALNGLRSTEPDHPFRASSLVVARELIIEPEQLSGVAVAVFSSRNIAEAILESTGIDVPIARLVPQRVRVEPVASVALRVVADGATEAEVSEIADTGAEALVAQLNEAGSIGIFVVQDTARIEEVESTSLHPVIVVGTTILAALLSWVLLLVLALLRRRPLTSGDDAAAVAGAPLLTTLRLRGGDDDAAAPLQARGIAVVAAHLLPDRTGVAVLAGINARATELVATLLHRVLTRSLGDATVWMRTQFDEDTATGEGVTTAVREAGSAEVVAIALPGLDVPQLVPLGSRVALLAVDGERADDLAALADQFAPGDLEGIVFVAGLRRRRRLRRTRAER